MKDFILKNKIVLVIVSIALVGALLVGVLLWNGVDNNNDNTKPTGSSQSSTQGTEGSTNPSDASDPTNATTPSDGTEPSDGTNPTEGTNPSEGTEPTDPSQGTEATDPSQGTEPPVTEPKPTEPPVTEPKPTDPPVTEPKPTDPPVTEPPVVIQPSTYPTEPEDEGYKGVTPDNLSEETVKNWDADDYNQFKWKYWDEMTPQEQYDYLVLVENNGVYYRCGKAGHHCMTPLEHERREAFICTYCGQNNCAGWGLRDGTMDTYNYMNCPEYNVFKDPMQYCQTCGKRNFLVGVNNILDTCQYNVMDAPCYYCGEYLRALECHTCKEENLKPEFKQYIIP